MDKLPVDRSSCEHILMGTDEVTVLASSAGTGGALFAVEIRMRPGGGPPVLHRHEPGEVYHVTAGEFTFYVGDGPDGAVRRVTARAGDVVPLAGGVPHTVRNESAGDATAFVVHAPGAPMEGFCRAVAAAAADGPPAMEQVLGIAAANGITLLGPVPAAGS
ncbi:cupin domain-containing protein [Actinoplanes nipponensis]|nr:cupin domain-containing protein [Actinoplanes nipponensis]